ncbi:MAG: AFG1 family ATPase [Proteobacteria bacterium]|nr:AFG1 family ATPase [Pseudomonadota bacterium]
MTLTERCRAELARHGYVPDAAQLGALAKLEQLRGRLARAARREAGLWWRLAAAFGRTPRRRAIRGLYLWGGVGRGKTLLMDAFAAELAVPHRRAHFHHFMQDVHARLAALRPQLLADPLARLAADLAADVRVLCFDELYVSDIADAMLLGGLFAALTERGVTLVFTSNVPPAGLYRDGLQRSRFLPAIRLLERATEVVEVDGGTDYRLRQLERAPLYVVGSGADADAALAERFAAIAGDRGATDASLVVEDRPIAVRRRAAGTIWFDFAALCEGPRATADYIAIAREHHTVLVSGVPAFDETRDDAARRFVALVDELYERGVKLVLSAAAAPAELYRGERLALEFRRTASRLAEMQSREYLARPHRP